MFEKMIFDGTSSFRIGQILVGKLNGADQKAIVLDKAEDSGELLLMALSDGTPFEVAAAEVKDWAPVLPPEARWVEVYDSESEEPFFAAYVPALSDAIAIGHVFEEREGDFRVEIFAATNEEQRQLGQS
jgi:hypothetical protein